MIPTDSLGALQSINTTDWRKNGLVNKIVLANHKLLYRGTTVQFMWIPAHQGIPGNANANFLAKLSTMRSPTHPEVAYNRASIQFCYSEACSLISIIACNCGTKSTSTPVEHSQAGLSRYRHKPNKNTHSRCNIPITHGAL